MSDIDRSSALVLCFAGLLCACAAPAAQGRGAPRESFPPLLPATEAPRVAAVTPRDPAPRGTGPLADLAAWDRASTDERRACADAVANRLPAFTPLGLRAFACGDARHEVALFRQERTGLEFALVPAGGGVAAPFLVSRTEATIDAWNRVMGDACPRVGPPRRAVGRVNWAGAAWFCRRAGLVLPTQAQWESACAAGSTTRFSFGDDARLVGDYAWLRDESADGASPGVLHDVGGKLPNAFGLFDMHGNAREWTLEPDERGRHVSLGQGADAGLCSSRQVREPCAPTTWYRGFRPVCVLPR